MAKKTTDSAPQPTVDDSPINAVIIEGVKYETHLPLSEWFNSRDITNWINKKCAKKIKDEAYNIIEAYRIYLKSLDKPNNFDLFDKKFYVKSHYIIAIKDQKVIGGAWHQGSYIHANAYEPAIKNTLENLMQDFIDSY
ncbi:MAG TPA: hypothetical protein VI790_04895 [Candidatus Nanoarchaeia archaeon]|nr:hypothetical protein [Candidatus Nanoarchaeia archaeon]